MAADSSIWSASQGSEIRLPGGDAELGVEQQPQQQHLKGGGGAEIHGSSSSFEEWYDASLIDEMKELSSYQRHHHHQNPASHHHQIRNSASSPAAFAAAADRRSFSSTFLDVDESGFLGDFAAAATATGGGLLPPPPPPLLPPPPPPRHRFGGGDIGLLDFGGGGGGAAGGAAAWAGPNFGLSIGTMSGAGFSSKPSQVQQHTAGSGSSFDEEQEERCFKISSSKIDGGGGSRSKSKSKSSSFKEAKDDGDDSFHEAESEYLEDRDKLPASSSSSGGGSSDLRIQALETFIGNIFATVSSLKAAYVQLQAAHSPFDPEKLRQADRAVIAELRRLSDMKHSFKEGRELPAKQQQQQGKKTAAIEDNAGRDELRRRVQELQAAATVKQRALEGYEQRARSCERQIAELNEEVATLRESLRRSAARREKLERRLLRTNRRGATSPAPPPPPPAAAVSSPPTVELFESAVRSAREAELGFVKLLVSLMRGAGWDLEAAAESIEPSIRYARPAHRRFAFESYAAARAFCGFENENFYINGSLSSILDPAKHRSECLAQFWDMSSVDPAELLGITPDCLFGQFCHRKYLQIVHERMEESFFSGTSQHRDVVLAGGHPRTSFYHSFLRFAKAVWLVHRLAFAMEPAAAIFQARRGTLFDPTFMDSATRNIRMSDDDDGVRPKVGFTVMPGFRLGSGHSSWVVKSVVIICSSSSFLGDATTRLP